MRYFLTLIAAALLASCITTPVTPIAPGNPGAPISFDAVIYANRAPLIPDYTRVQLSNGVVLLLLEKPEVPLIGFQALLRGGAVADAPGHSGTASLLAELLRKGAGQRNAAEFAATVEGVGGQLNTNAGMEALQVGGSFLSRDADLGVSLLADMLQRPHLDEEEFTKLRARAVQFIKAAKDGAPNQLIGFYAASQLFGEHPYGRSSAGDEDSLAALQMDALKKYYRDHVGADRLILAVAGDFDTDAMVARLDAAFGSWRRAQAPLPQYGSAEKVSGGTVLLIDKPDATQTYFWFGNVGVAKHFPRRAALALANTVFGGSFTSMLNTELRIKSGLTYGASSQLRQPMQAGSVGVASFTRTETTTEAIDLALATLQKLHQEGLDDTAIGSAKAYILGQYPLGFETAAQLARRMTDLEFYQLDRAYINDYALDLIKTDRATIDDVITRVYPATDELVFVMIGNAAAIREQVSKYGQLSEMKITAPTFYLK